ncbi:MAG: hypothetical protein JKY67_20795 [Pseudomonadales bacterium]|nr:hypothetical protein [Pseudomonadales bacterium]
MSCRFSLSVDVPARYTLQAKADLFERLKKQPSLDCETSNRFCMGVTGFTPNIVPTAKLKLLAIRID